MPSRGHPACGCGYEDQNDATTLRHDPLRRLVCGHRPESDTPLASQPTCSRRENAVMSRACYRIVVALGMVSLRERGTTTIPTRIVLNRDATDDPAHGAQEGTRYHGYYHQHRYQPLPVFDDDTDQSIIASSPTSFAASSMRQCTDWWTRYGAD